MQSKKQKYLVTGLVLLLAILLVYYFKRGFVINNNQLYKGGQIYTKVDGYNYVEPGFGTCMAISPECGVCLGAVINKQCYIKAE